MPHNNHLSSVHSCTAGDVYSTSGLLLLFNKWEILCRAILFMVKLLQHTHTTAYTSKLWFHVDDDQTQISGSTTSLNRRFGQITFCARMRTRVIRCGQSTMMQRRITTAYGECRRVEATIEVLAMSTSLSYVTLTSITYSIKMLCVDYCYLFIYSTRDRWRIGCGINLSWDERERNKFCAFCSAVQCIAVGQ